MLMLLALIASSAPLCAAEELRVTNNGSTAGYLTLDWSVSAAKTPYTVQMNKGQGWQTIYHGKDTATTLTGLKNGDYQFRLNSADPATIDDDHWSAPLEVTIQHHSLTKAVGFFVSGFVIFIILLGLLFRPSNPTQQREG